MQNTQTKEKMTPLWVPKSHREILFHTAHHNPMARCLGQDKPLNSIMAHFFLSRHWLRCVQMVCSISRLSAGNSTPKVQLHPLSLTEFPFERISMDLIWPLEMCMLGYRFVLVLVDCATRQPEAVPLCYISACSVAVAFFHYLPKDILDDQGTSFVQEAQQALQIISD